MKLVELSYAIGKDDTDDKFVNLVLESMEDVITYCNETTKDYDKEVLQHWKLASDSLDPETGVIDMREFTHSVDKTMGLRFISNSIYYNLLDEIGKINGDRVEITFSDFENYFVEKINSVFTQLIKLMANGSKIRITIAGGYSKLDDFYKVHKEIECSTEMMLDYLSHKYEHYSMYACELSASSDVIAIENSDMLSDRVNKKFDELDINGNGYIANNFNRNIGQLRDYRLYNTFKLAFENGVHSIIFETLDAQDGSFKRYWNLLNTLLEEPDVYNRLNNGQLYVYVHIRTDNPVYPESTDRINIIKF